MKCGKNSGYLSKINQNINKASYSYDIQFLYTTLALPKEHSPSHKKTNVTLRKIE